MQRISTQIHYQKLTNDALYYIYRYIDTDINIDELCRELRVSRFHFQRIFKKQMGINIYENIKSIRLQKASNLLLTHHSSTISEIALSCGYSSQSSFIRAFQKRFSMTPTEWRNGGFRHFVEQNFEGYSLTSHTKFEKLEPKIITTEPQKAYYMRHLGYNPQVKKVWQKMLAWIYTHEIKSYTLLGLYHDNPIVTPLSQCAYVAAIIPNGTYELKANSLPYFTIPGGLYATFRVKGVYGDILRLIEWAYHDWLPSSGFETSTMPSYTIFEKNHFLEEDEIFSVLYHLPIRFR